MMGVRIEILGMDRLNSFVIGLPKNVMNEINQAGDEFCKFVQKSAKLRAPRDTGHLAESIEILHPKKNQISVTVTSPWAFEQETGRSLPHYMPRWAVRDKVHKTSSILKSGELPQRRGLTVARRYTPFLMPAFNQGLIQLPDLIQRHLDKAIVNSGGK